MKKKSEVSFLRSLITVMLSNVVTLISGILVGLVIPQIMGVINYGYYKIFMLYATYASVLHFGFIDGILLKYGGKTIDELDRYEIRSNTKFIFLFEFGVGVVMLTLSHMYMSSVYQKIFMFLSLYTILVNMVTYYQFMSQSMLKFSILSKINVIQAVLNIVVVLSAFLLFEFHKIGYLKYYNYIILYLIIFLIVLAMYMHEYKSFTFGRSYKIVSRTRENLAFFKSGISLTLSYQIAVLILNLDNQFISLLYSARVFGVYSFAYSLISLTTTVLTAISTVLFPHLNRSKIEDVIHAYDSHVGLLLIVVYFAMLVYYPVDIFVKAFLTKYVGSLIYFRILLPGVGITSCISLIVFNYYKILKKGRIYFELGIVVLILSVIFNYVIYLMFNSPVAIATASLFEIFFWYLLTNLYLCRLKNIIWRKNTFYLLIMVILFEVTTLIPNKMLSMLMYFALYLIVTYFMHRKTVVRLFDKFFQVS